jgi:hypothetical protein
MPTRYVVGNEELLQGRFLQGFLQQVARLAAGRLPHGLPQFGACFSGDG